MPEKRRSLIFVTTQLFLLGLLYWQRTNVWSHPVFALMIAAVYEIAVVVLMNLEESRTRLRLTIHAISDEKKRLDLPKETLGFCNAAISSIHKRDYEEAVRNLERANVAAHELRAKEAESLYESASRMLEARRIQPAIKLLKRAKSLVTDGGIKEGEAAVLNLLGVAYSLAGEFALAVGYLEPALAGAREVGSFNLEADIAATLGTAYAELGEHDRAAESHLHALIIGGEIGGPSFRAKTLVSLASDHRALNENAKAVSDLKRGYDVLVEDGALDAAAQVKEFIADASTLPSSTENVEFSAFYDEHPELNSRQSLQVFIHLGALGDEIDIGRIAAERRKPGSATTEIAYQIKVGTVITVVPESDQLEFEPYALSRKWNGSWIRYDFEFKAEGVATTEKLIRISIQIMGIEIAHIDCVITLTNPELTDQTAPENPLTVAKLKNEKTYLYRSIFISYSRRDRKIIDVYKFAQLAIGDDIFVDTASIRTGENWQKALARAIDEADIFQLFWSANSAASENVRHEWDYALTQRCPGDGCVGFIRPFYWEQPMPPPPPPLKHLNFRFVALPEAPSAEA